MYNEMTGSRKEDMLSMTEEDMLSMTEEDMLSMTEDMLSMTEEDMLSMTEEDMMSITDEEGMMIITDEEDTRIDKTPNEMEENWGECDAAFSEHYVIIVGSQKQSVQNREVCMGFEDVYELQEKIGEGTFGVVRRGINLITGRNVAIKIQKDKEKDSTGVFKKEIENLRELTEECKSFICIEGWGMYKGKVFIAMEYVNGISLDEYMRRTDVKFRTRKFKDITEQLVRAVETLHEKGMAHTDIKPENVMIDLKTTRVKLIDFGLGCKGGTKCHMGGTRMYMPNRPIKGTLGDRQKTDWYSLGLTVLELVDEENNFSYRRFFPLQYVQDLQLPREIYQVIRDLLIQSGYV